MSGIITGPYFKYDYSYMALNTHDLNIYIHRSYFDNPDATQLGTMVAILVSFSFKTELLNNLSFVRKSVL